MARADENSTLAFPGMRHIPSGCGLLPIIDDRCEPWFYERDSAVVDYSQRDIEIGELFVLASRSGPRVWEIRPVPATWRIKSEHPCYNVLRPNRYRSKEQLNAAIRSGFITQTADGPYPEPYLLSVIIGKIIGRWDVDAEEIEITPDLPGWLVGKSLVKLSAR